MCPVRGRIWDAAGWCFTPQRAGLVRSQLVSSGFASKASIVKDFPLRGFVDDPH